MSRIFSASSGVMVSDSGIVIWAGCGSPGFCDGTGSKPAGSIDSGTVCCSETGAIGSGTSCCSETGARGTSGGEGFGNNAENLTCSSSVRASQIFFLSAQPLAQVNFYIG